MRTLRLLIVGLIVGLVALGATVSAALAVQVRPHYGVTIQAVYDTHGNPVLVANFSPNGALAHPRWSSCAPPATSVCRQVAGDAQGLTPGPTKPGTVFKATATYKGTRYAAISAAWLGRVRAVSRPSLRGELRPGARVNPTAASWQGGWKVDPSYNLKDGGAQSGGRAAPTDQLSVEACRTRAGTHCLNLSPPNGPAGGGTGAARIGTRFKGWYLFAFDQRFSGDAAFAGVGYASPEDAPTLKVGPTIARSGPYGPVR